MVVLSSAGGDDCEVQWPADHDDFQQWVQLLADPARAKRAYWHLVLSSTSALPAIRTGLGDENPDVRDYCTKALDHLVDEESFPQLIEMLGDQDHRVRVDALHALACDRCKDTVCRPSKEAVLGKAMALLHNDPHKHVRAMSVEVVARWVHTDPLAAEALTEARTMDSEPSVRKKASWYAPGGPIYRKTMPKRAHS